MKIRKTISSLSLKRIVISLLILFSFPLLKSAVKQLAREETLATAFSFNLIGCILLIYDWELVAVHYKRAKKNFSATVTWMFIGILLIGIWLFTGKYLLQAKIILPEEVSLQNSLMVLIAALPAYTLLQASIIHVSFKCITDHLSVHQREELVILLSGFLFGPIYTLLFFPYTLEIFAPTLLYNIVLIVILSYLYNQSGNLVSGTLAMGFCYLSFIILMIL